MRVQSLASLTAVAALLAACQGKSPGSASVPDDLQRDLQAASSSDGLQLANTSTDFQRNQFVSEIEQSNRSAPTTQVPRPRPKPRVRAGDTNQETLSPSPEPAVEAEAPQPTQPEPATDAPAADEPRVPMVAPRPAPVPVDVATTGGGSGRGTRGGEAPPDIGDVIGVIFRPRGQAGDDHCIPRRRPGRGGLPFPLPLEQLPSAVRPLIAHIK